MQELPNPSRTKRLRQIFPLNTVMRQDNWFGLTTRGRVVYASNDRVAQNEITYEELADPKWKGKICTRDGQHPYNIALFASMVSHLGKEKAEDWLTGLKNNLARKAGRK